MSENTTPEPQQPRRPRSRSLFWPILLIALGVLFLLNNLGVVAWGTWNLVWRLWPLVLVAVGLDLLIGGRSALGAILSALVALALVALIAAGVFFADQLPFLDRYAVSGEWQTSHVEHHLDDYQAADVYIDWSSPPGRIYALETDQFLIEGDLTYLGELVFDVDDRGGRADLTLDSRWTGSWSSFGPGRDGNWEIGLTPEIPLDLTLDSGSGSCDFDLSGLIVEDLFLDSGSGSIQLALPAEQSFRFELDSGSGSVQIDLPEDTGVRVRLDSGSGSFNPGGEFILVSGERRGDGIWESENYDIAEYIIEITIDQGSGSITFR